MESVLLTPQEICERYHISLHTLYQWTASNYIPHLKIGGQLRFRLSDLLKWEEDNLVGAHKAELL